MMAEIHRTNLEWARDIARSYRAALRAVDPVKCSELDRQAVALGQRWIAPAELPTEAALELIDAVLTPADISQALAMPVGTIYGWVSKGLLKPAVTDVAGVPLDPAGPAKYRVRDVLTVHGRRRTRRLDTA